MTEFERLNGVGTALAGYFNNSGVPLGFPELKLDEELLFDYETDGPEHPLAVKIPDYETMVQWCNAGRFGFVGVIGWRIAQAQDEAQA